MCLQRYIWWKKSIEVWTRDHPFPIDIDYMISDTLELLRPKMRFSCSLEDATKQVADLEREVLVKLGTSHEACVCVCERSPCVTGESASCVFVQPPGRLVGLSSIPRCVGGRRPCQTGFA